MAKNKKTQHKPGFRPITPERYMREKVGSLPPGPCYVAIDPGREARMIVVATKLRPGGNLVYVRFVVDTYCRGVCTWKWEINIPREEVAKRLKQSTMDFREIPASDVASLVRGSVAFAEDGGLRPPVGYKYIANILVPPKEDPNPEEVPSATPEPSAESSPEEAPSAEPTGEEVTQVEPSPEETPSAEPSAEEGPVAEAPRRWVFGRENRHCLIVGLEGTERKYIPQLRDALGDDGFDLIELLPPPEKPGKPSLSAETAEKAVSGEDAVSESAGEPASAPESPKSQPSKSEKKSEKKSGKQSAAVPESPQLIAPVFKPDTDNDEAYAWAEDDGEGYRVEEYHYKAPAYPRKLSLTSPWLYDELSSAANRTSLPDELIDRILALPPEDLAADLRNIILYEIGRTRRKLDLPSSDNPSVVHSVLLLTHLGRHESLSVAMELLRQGTAFLTLRLGVGYTDLFGSLLCRCGLSAPEVFMDFLQERGRQAAPRSVAVDALMAAMRFYPEKRRAIVDFFKGYIPKVIKGLRKCEYCDPVFAGYLVFSLLQTRPSELLSEIRQLLATGSVATSLCCPPEELEKSMGQRRPTSIDNFTSLRASYPLAR